MTRSRGRTHETHGVDGRHASVFSVGPVCSRRSVARRDGAGRRVRQAACPDQQRIWQQVSGAGPVCTQLNWSLVGQVVPVSPPQP